MMKVFIAIPCHACFTTLLWVMLWYCMTHILLFMYGHFALKKHKHTIFMSWPTLNLVIFFFQMDVCGKRINNFSPFVYLWWIVREVSSHLVLYECCLMDQMYDGICMGVIFHKKLRYDNTLEMGHNNGGTCHWWRSWWYLRTLLTFLALGTFTHPNLLFLIVSFMNSHGNFGLDSLLAMKFIKHS